MSFAEASVELLFQKHENQPNEC
eukprot:SAG22_NODE_7719_length_714_cov_1.504065_1_plen_22_part_10